MTRLNVKRLNHRKIMTFSLNMKIIVIHTGDYYKKSNEILQIKIYSGFLKCTVDLINVSFVSIIIATLKLDQIA